MLEKEFSDLIASDTITQRRILDALEIPYASFVRETVYINGITTDFTMIANDTIIGIIECKKATIGVTEYIRGIGQLLQQEYFFETNIMPKKHQHCRYTNAENFKNILLIPSDFVKNTSINIGFFKYPKTSGLLELNIENNFVRKIAASELENYRRLQENQAHIISQYYIRDNRLFEIYILLRYIRKIGAQASAEQLNRATLEKNLQKINTINNNNWRNAFISASNLGFINSQNQLTNQGLVISNQSCDEFVVDIYKAYLSPYIDELMDVFAQHPTNIEFEMANKNISDQITSKYNKNVMFLTESNNRYISSWLNILRDDLGCLEFAARSKVRRKIYTPKELNKQAMLQKIRENTVSKIYVDKFENLLKTGIL